MIPSKTDVVVVGGGPAGLSAAQHAAARGLEVHLFEKNSEIGSPIHTSGGSFIEELRKLGIADHFWHPVSDIAFQSPHNEVTFNYPEPVGCVLDIRALYQNLAEKASSAGACLHLKASVTGGLLEGGKVIGVRVSNNVTGEKQDVQARLTIDASGFQSVICQSTGFRTSFNRFGVGAEYDLFAPNFPQNELSLLVGNQVAPAGYAWLFPYGKQRVRAGVGVIQPDVKSKPSHYLDSLLQHERYREALNGAQPVEYHAGLIPSIGLCETMVTDGLISAGDAAGQASTLVGEGIRYCIEAGQLAGEAASLALKKNDTSVNFLYRHYQRVWEKRHGRSMQMSLEINKRLSALTDEEWDRGVEVLKGFSPELFADLLQGNFSNKVLLKTIAQNPNLLRKAVTKLIH